jgi:hypothetical protein
MLDPEVKSLDWSDELARNKAGPKMLATTATIGHRAE